MTHLGDDVLMTEHHQRGMHLGGENITTRMAGGLAAANLQGQITQGIGGQ